MRAVEAGRLQQEIDFEKARAAETRGFADCWQTNAVSFCLIVFIIVIIIIIFFLLLINF
jgi:hypothetical protein